MRLFLTLILCLSANVWAQKRSAPDLNVVDQYIQLALRVAPKEFEKKGPFSCEKAIPLGEPLRVHGANLKDAETRYILRCIQIECARLDSKIQEEMNSMRSLPEAELIELMRFAGFSQVEIDRVIENRTQPNAPAQTRIDCRNATPLGRMYVFDSCAALPLSCGPT